MAKMYQVFLLAAVACIACQLGHAAGRRALCPNVPPGMLNAINKIGRNARKTASEKTTYDMGKTPTHVFHNNTDVYVATCAMKWDTYHENPDQYSFFKHLQVYSGCGNHNGVTCLTNPPKNPRAILCTDPRQYVLPYNNDSVVVERLSDYELQEDTDLDPDLFIFHEGRVGSTLTANMFGSSRDNLVLVEDKVSTALIFDYGKVWQEAKSEDCKNIVVEVVRTIMRRQALSKDASLSQPHHRRLVYKFEPHAIVYYEMLSKAFPSTPWVFLYRNPIETLWSFMSVLHEVRNPAGIYCVRNQRKPHDTHLQTYRSLEPDLSINMNDIELRKILREYVPKEDFCALHLEMLQRQALKAVDIANAANPGKKIWALVDHKELPTAITNLDVALPSLFQDTPLSGMERGSMEVQGSLNAKGLRGNSLLFKDDRTKKQQDASDEVLFASRFLTTTYELLAQREKLGSKVAHEDL